MDPDETTQEKPRLLLVDDDQGVLESLSWLLKDRYTITSCLDGHEALRFLAAETFDLVVTDLRLPDITGLDILNAAKYLPDAPAVIIITGYATLDSVVEATNDGASAYVPKPMNPEHFRSIVSRVLERQQLERDLRESERRYRRLYQQSQQRVLELQLLFEASQLLGQPFDVQEIVQRVVHILNRLFGHQDRQVSVLLFEDEADSLVHAELSAALEGTAQEYWLHTAALCPIDCPVRAGRLLRLTTSPVQPVAQSLDAVCPLQQSEAHHVLCLPIVIGEHVVGALHCATWEIESFAESDQRLLATLAGQVSAVLEGLQAVRQRERLAVLEERDRMARALHDGLAQRFSYLGLSLDNQIALVEDGRLDQARDDLAQLRGVVDEGQAEIRATIAGLRRVTDARFLGTELAAFVRHWSNEHQIATRFRCVTPDSLQLSPNQAEHFMGIVQEALANVAKHAQATQVEVVVTTRDEENVLSIVDDGVGFDPTRPAVDDIQHFGMIILEERATLMGGRLAVTSAPDQGTRIEVFWPLVAGRGKEKES